MEYKIITPQVGTVKTMCDSVMVEQRAPMSSNVTQIGIQNNGISPQDACQLALDLFVQNFPKLQELAAETARQRSEEFCRETIKKLQSEGNNDFTAFSDPDVQYVLLNAQTDYARFGTKELLESLTTLISKRVKHDDEFILKVTIDKALSIVNLMTSEQLDLLSLMFLCENVKFGHIDSVQTLQKNLNSWADTFASANVRSMQYLTMLGCTTLTLPNPVKILAKTYGLPNDEVDQICPPSIKALASDYGLSLAGVVLAIVNAEIKLRHHFDMRTWIHT